MSQVSYGTITITDTTDIESIYMIYKGGDTNTDAPSINWINGQVDWKTDITEVEGNYIWVITVYKKTGIEITQQNYQDYFSDPVCLTGSLGRGVRLIKTFYCNYGSGEPAEDYSGWEINVPEYDSSKPNYWVKTEIIYVDSTEKEVSKSGDIVTIDNAEGLIEVMSAKVTLDPIQDLHGYDHPWSGGAGKNLIQNIDVTLPANEQVQPNISEVFSLPAGTYTLSFTVGSTVTSATRCRPFYNVNGVNTYADADYKTAGRHSWTFTLSDDAPSIQMRWWAHTLSNGTTITDVQLEKGSTATSYTPWENICPIYGRTGCEVDVTGKNLLNNVDPTVLNAYLSWSASEGKFKIVSNASNRTVILPVKPSTTYTYTWNRVPIGSSSDDSNVVMFDHYPQIGSFGVSTGNNILVTGGTRTFTTQNDTVYVAIKVANVTNTDFTETLKASQLELGTATAYEPYEGDTYTTTLGRTVYGGTLDVVSGELVVDRAMVDLGTLSWVKRKTSSGHYRFTAEADVYNPSSTTVVPNLVCSIYPTITPADSWLGVQGISCNINASQILVSDENYADATAFKTAMDGVQLCYELATPQTIQLTPQEVELLLGQNNVWSDGLLIVSGFTIADRDIKIYKDNGLTDALTKATNALTTASSTEIAQQVLANKLRKIWINEVTNGNYLAGTYAASGLTNGADSGFNITNPETYGFNSLLRHTYLSFRYNTHQLVTIGTGADSTVSGIVINTPIVNSQNVITGAKKGIELTNEALKFYQQISNVDRVVTQIGASGIFMNPNGIIGTNSTVEGFFIEKADNNTVGMGFRERATASHAAVATNYSFAIGGEASFGVEEYGSTIDAVQGSIIEIPTKATGKFSFAQGNGARALHDFSTAIGEGIVTGRASQLVIGKWNKVDTDAIFVIGNGSGEQVTNAHNVEGVTADEGRSNLLLVTNSGDLKIKDGFKIINDSNNYIQLDSDSMDIYQDDEGTSVRVASFGVNGAQIGRNGESRLELDYHSMKLIDKEGDAYFHVSDLRSNHIATDEYGEGFYAVVTDTFIGNGSSIDFFLSNRSLTINYKVYVDGIEESNVTKAELRFALTTAPADGSVVTATYPTASQAIKAYTAGLRKNDENVGVMSFAEGMNATASGPASHAEGSSTKASGDASHAEGNYTAAKGHESHAEGNATTASGPASHAEGSSTTASGYASHAEGHVTKANGYASHAEGSYTTASELYSHAEGSTTTASGHYSHAEGSDTTASGHYSHAEGNATTASGYYSHAEGNATTASGRASHAQNWSTIAQRKSQTAIGEFNEADTEGASVLNRGKYAVIIGNGTADNARSNALTVDWNGRLQCGDYGGVFQSIFDILYPVGSYYYTSDANFNPNTVWGGTWTKLGEGTVLMSGGGTNYNVGTTYGGNTKNYTPAGSVAVTVATHTLTTTEIPAHDHGSKTLTGYVDFRRWNASGGSLIVNTNGILSQSNVTGTANVVQGTSNNNGTNQRMTVTATHTHTSVGGSGAHGHSGSTGSFTGTQATLNVMQSSLAVYIWHRTA